VRRISTAAASFWLDLHARAAIKPNHTIARIQSQTQQGLTLEQAEKATEALAWANDHQESIGQLK